MMTMTMTEMGSQGAVAPAVKPGGFWIRFVAVIIDGLILSTLQVPISFMLGLYSGLTSQAQHIQDPFQAFDPQRLVAYGISMLIGWLVQLVYCWLFYRYKGATPGKMVLGLKVVDAGTGAYLGFGQTFLRESVGKFLSTACLGIGYLMAGLRSDKKALHDLVAGTQVIRRA